jgi:hypothetical protein
MRALQRWLLAITMAMSFAVSAQDMDSLLLKPDTLYTAEDSLSIFSLIDSLLNLEEQMGSQLALRLSYNSNVLSAGRTLGIDNFGLSPGLSYYHKSGFYGDISGFWSNDFEPSYYLTIASAGYMRDLSKSFSVMAGYDHYFYHTSEEDMYVPYSSTLSITPVYELKKFTFSANYSFYFGEKFAHRLMPGIGFRLEKKKLLKKIDRISINPSLYLLWGNEALTEIEYVPPQNVKQAIANYLDHGNRFTIVARTRDVFGLMNYSFALPLVVSLKHWGLTLTYAYNIPKALPGEPDALSESSYVSASFMYFIDLKRNKKPL